MFARSMKPNHTQFSSNTTFPPTMYVSAIKHTQRIQKVERSRSLIVNTSKKSQGLKYITVTNDVLTFVYAKNKTGIKAATITEAKKYMKDFHYGHRNEKQHDSWHFGKMYFDLPHIHIVKAYFDPTNFTKLVTPKEFESILSDIEKNSRFLKKEDAKHLKENYASFYNRNTKFSAIKGLAFFQSKDTQASSLKNPEKTNEKRLRR